MSTLLRKVKSTIATRSTKPTQFSKSSPSTPDSEPDTSCTSYSTINTPPKVNIPSVLSSSKTSCANTNAFHKPPNTLSKVRPGHPSLASSPTAIPAPQNPAILSQPDSISPHQDIFHQSPVAQFRERLARKASTFTLRGKSWRSPFRRDSAQPRQQSPEIHSQRLRDPFPGERETTTSSITEVDLLQAKTTKAVIDSGFKNTDHRILTATSSLSTLRLSDDQLNEQHRKEQENILAEVRAFQPSRKVHTSSQLSPTLKGLRGGALNHSPPDAGTSIKIMASDHAAPPVPYTRLKDITESACEAALSGVTSYSHADTESWNTTIINSILGALVQETTQQPAANASSSSPPPPQPNFKYVVNSTIIQHAGSSSTSASDNEPKKLSGRRGMHAASGAYWNNEKDGMWSFKYPGADSKGLDVVVGIIWVWVG